MKKILISITILLTVSLGAITAVSAQEKTTEISSSDTQRKDKISERSERKQNVKANMEALLAEYDLELPELEFTYEEIRELSDEERQEAKETNKAIRSEWKETNKQILEQIREENPDLFDQKNRRNRR